MTGQPPHPAILHLITGVNVGGAEAMLAKLLRENRRAEAPLREEVCALMRPGPVGRQLMSEGFTIHSAGLRAGVPGPAAFMRVRNVIKTMAPDIIVAWMHHGFFAASVIMPTLKKKPALIWNVRHSLSDIQHEKPMTRLILRACKKLSGSANAIIYNAHISKDQYEKFGFDASKSVIIANGFDVDHNKPDSAARARLTEIFSIPDDRIIIAMIARQHPMKDHATLVRAAGRLLHSSQNIHLLLVGDDLTDPAPDLAHAIKASLPDDRLTLSNHRKDIADWLPGIDIFALSSAWGEGFPNVIGEAMACGASCIATDVGDSARIIDDKARIAAPGDVESLTAALHAVSSLTHEQRRALGEKDRRRIVENFSMPEIAAQYRHFYSQTHPLIKFGKT